jgi:hypothetical protein
VLTETNAYDRRALCFGMTHGRVCQVTPVELGFNFISNNERAELGVDLIFEAVPRH